MKARLEQDLRDAMKAQDTARRDTIRFVLSAIHNEEVAKRGDLDDPAIEAVLRKQTKMRRESIEAFTKGARAELAAKETKELQILESYLPKQLDEETVRVAAAKAIAETGATGPKEQGKVMQKLMPELKGQADGGMVSRVVSEMLKPKV